MMDWDKNLLRDISEYKNDEDFQNILSDPEIKLTLKAINGNPV